MGRGTRTGLVVVLGAGLFLAGGLGLLARPAPSADGPAVVAAPEALAGQGSGGGSVAATIASLQDRLTQVPGDWQASASLGLAYVQQARVTQDPSLYPKAEEVLMGSLALRPDDNAAALIGLSSLASARHDFSAALEYGERARAINPYDGAVHGVIGDALVELGRYREAAVAYQEMVDTEPGFAAYARVSYARELRGDVAGAERAMRAALEVAGTAGDTAFAAFQLGELAWNSGRPVQAGRWYERAAAADPAWVPPLAGLARVEWAQGDLEGAIEAFDEVVTRYPSPEYVVWLGDLLTLAGRDDEAAAQYDLARAEAGLFRANGVNVDLELALFEADHGEARDALEAASAEWERRRSIHVADAYAWALHAAGDDRLAVRYSRRALSLGTRNALFLYHAGTIELALSHRGAAERLLERAADTNPWFLPLGARDLEATLERIS